MVVLILELIALIPTCPQVIKWLLNHDQSKRPTAEELLASDLLPPARLEDNELHEMLRHVLANPQSKTYKHLVARCLAQQSDTVLEMTYHMGLVQTNPKLELVKVSNDQKREKNCTCA